MKIGYFLVTQSYGASPVQALGTFISIDKICFFGIITAHYGASIFIRRNPLFPFYYVKISEIVKQTSLKRLNKIAFKKCFLFI